jgi:hypothetical protein
MVKINEVPRSKLREINPVEIKSIERGPYRPLNELQCFDKSYSASLLVHLLDPVLVLVEDNLALDLHGGRQLASFL